MLMDKEPDVTYMPTAEIQRHEPPSQRYTLTEVPGYTPDSEIQRIQIASDYDLVVFVFRLDKALTQQYYLHFWTGSPPVPVVVVGVSPSKTDGNRGEDLKYELIINPEFLEFLDLFLERADGFLDP
ncbi:putative AC transposase [Purpureocillium lavendulum]|uniref:AC transposase n=1 Tax=Purpureocillium lavendulum TaxID=1247861 RepID=A0AB34FBN1_9HYPO|nr:putative AC transposase [Purpureocillium lavendulum]